MDLGLTDRVYVVTGGSRGLGWATAEVLVAEGARVVVCSRSEQAVARAATELGGADHAIGIAGDVVDPGTEARVVAAAIGRWERLDGALLSVGGPPPGAAALASDSAWRTAFETVVVGPLRVARSVASLLGADGGSIAFILSTSVRQPIEGLALSNGLRPGLAMAAKTLADELGMRGVRVNGLLPGRIDTDRSREIDTLSGRPATVRRESEAQIPLRRYGTPAEFGRVAAFVLSPAASYLTGSMITIDGGATRAL
jgi:3-oxoacyl-[acyl-carrier protein] reductase